MKKYLSYSQYALWKKDREAYERKYFEGEPPFETKETLFGKKIAEMLEQKNVVHPILSKVPRGECREWRVETRIHGIPTLSVLDSFSPAHGSIFENKTGRIPWTQERVDTHDQLLFYAAAVNAQCGFFDPHLTLSWLETKQEPLDMEVGEETLYSSERDGVIELTGRLFVFTRTITPAEVVAFGDKIVEVWGEIKEAWDEYTRLK